MAVLMESNVTSHRHDEKQNKWVLHLKPDGNISVLSIYLTNYSKYIKCFMQEILLNLRRQRNRNKMIFV